MVLTTQKGYFFFEVSSAFQKSIRRGDENQAMYWAVELYMSNYDEYLWKRIRIITSEDIGLAEPFLAATITALYQNYTDQKKKNGDNREERLFLIHAVLLLARAKKSRLVDYTLMNYFMSYNDTRFEIPDYALDKHTLKGKMMKRGVDHFFTVGCHLENHSEQEGEPEMKSNAHKLAHGPAPVFSPRRSKRDEENILFGQEEQE